MAQLVVSVAGAAVGFAIGGPAGAKWGWMAGSLLGAAFTPNQKQEGPRLEDMSVSSSAYGTTIPYLEGHCRMAGQLIWASEKREIATTEEQGGKGGGGVDVTTYTYEADLHFLLTDNPIEGVTRIWVNGKLIWNWRTGLTVETQDASDNTNAWARMTVYTGASTQMPDPDGHPDAPAYRGRGSIFFKSYGLGSSGAIPNITFEVTRTGVQGTGDFWITNWDNVRKISSQTGGVLQTIAADMVNTFAYDYSAEIDQATGRVWVASFSDIDYEIPVVAQLDPTATTEVVATYGFPASEWLVIWIKKRPGTNEMWVLTYPTTDDCLYIIDTTTGTVTSSFALTGTSEPYMEFFWFSADGSKLFFSAAHTGYNFYGYDIATATQLWSPITDVSGEGDVRGFVQTQVGGTNYGYLSQGKLYEINLDTGTVTDSLSPSGYPLQDGGGLAMSSDKQYLYWGRYSGNTLDKVVRATLTVEDTLTIPDAMNQSDFVSDVYTQDLLIDAEDSALYVNSWTYGQLVKIDLATFTQVPDWLVINEASPAGIASVSGYGMTFTEPTLRQVVERLCAMSGLQSNQYDASALDAITTPVHGMLMSQITSVRTMLEQLATAYFFECRLADKLYFTPRATSTVVDIDYTVMGATNQIGAVSDPLPLTQINEMEIPSQMALTYMLESRDYQTDTQYSDRLITTQENTSANQLPLVMTESEAKVCVDILLSDKALSALQSTFAVSRYYSKYEPNDIINVTDKDGDTFQMRVVAKRETDGAIEFRVVRSDAEILNQEGLTEISNVEQMEVYAVGATKFQVIDTVLFTDSANEPGVFIAVDSAVSDGWNGCEIMRSSDNVTFAMLRSVASQTVIGFVEGSGPLPAPTRGDVMDFTNTVVVRLNQGDTLSSVTRDQLLNDETINAAWVNGELIQFQTATLVGTDTYRLSNLLRGRRGSDVYFDAPLPSNTEESFVLLRTGGMAFIPTPTGDLGRTRYWKAVTFGQRSTDATSEEYAPMAVNMKPIAPVNPRANRDASDTVISWQRRTRLSSRFTGDLPPSCPLGEQSEAYEIEIYSSSAYTTLKRTLTSTSESVTYTSAQQTTDFGSGQTVLYVKIYQMSAIVGRGFALTATI